MDQNITRYENKITAAKSMTELLQAMSLWQSYVNSHTVSEEEKQAMDALYLKAEAAMMSKLSKSPW